MINFTALSLGLVLFQSPAQSTPMKVDRMICTVAVEVRGKVLRFLVDTGSTTTLIDPAKVPPGSGALDGQVVGLEPRFTIRAYPLPAFKDVTVATSFDGILGADVLLKWAFGLDYAQGNLCFWPTGITPEDAQAWLKVGSSAKMRTIRLADDGQGRFRIAAANGARPYLFDTGANLINVTEPDLDGALRADIDSGRVSTPLGPVELKRQFVRSLNVGGVRPAWLVITLGTDRDAEPVVGAHFFRSPRTVIDAPNHRLFVTQPSAVSEAEDALERVFGSPVHMEGETVWVDAKANLRNGGNKVVRIRVLTAGGMAVESLAKDLIRGKDAALYDLTKLYKLLREGCEVQLEIEGKPVTSKMKIAS